MKKEELKEGKIYRTTGEHGTWIFKNEPPYYQLETKLGFFTKRTSTNGLGDYNFTSSTENQKLWLNACIEANKFIPFEEVVKPETNLEKAKRLYYKGVIYHSLFTDVLCESNGEYHEGFIDGYHYISTNGEAVFSNGQWAEIISTTDEVTEREYKDIMPGHLQNLFNTLKDVCDFTATQSEMAEIVNALHNDCQDIVLTEQSAIDLLKSKGYKISKPVTTYEDT